MNNLTKVWGKHTFKAGLYYQRASNSSNSQTNVAGVHRLHELRHEPAQHRPPVRQRAAGRLQLLHPGQRQAGRVVLLLRPVRLHPGHLEAHARASPWTWACGSRTTSRTTTSIGDGAYFDPSLYNPASAPRLYRPVCVALPCSGNNLRAMDPASVGRRPPRRTPWRSFYVGKIVPNSGDLTNGMGLTAEGYPRGGFNGQAILPQPRLGFTWDVSRRPQDGAARRLRDLLRPLAQRRRRRERGHQPAVRVQPDADQRLPAGHRAGRRRAPSRPQTVQALDPDGKQTAVYSYSLGVQRDLGKGIVVDVAYVGSQIAPQPAPREPEPAALRDHVPGLGAGPDQDGRRRAGGGAGPAQRPIATPA